MKETRLLVRKDNFEPLHLITEKFSTLRKYSSRLLSALQLMATPAALPLNDALDTIREMYRKQLRKVPSSAPLDFIPESWKKMELFMILLDLLSIQKDGILFIILKRGGYLK